MRVLSQPRSVVIALVLSCGLGGNCRRAPAEESIGPSDVPAMARRADASFQAAGYRAAAALYEKLVVLNPTVGLYWYRLGESRRLDDRCEEAIAPLEKAEELGGFQRTPPRWVHRGEVAFSLAAAHAALGHTEKAIEWTRIALRQGLRDIHKFQADGFSQLLADPDFRRLVWADGARDLSRDEGYRLDLRFAMHEVKRLHYSPFRAKGEAEIDAMTATLAADIPNLTDDQIFVRMMAIVRQFGDAHTTLLGGQSRLPVIFFAFPEGLYITGATRQHADLVGAKVLKICEEPASEALARAETLVAQENPMTPRCLAPRVLGSSAVLRGLGFVPPNAPISIEIEDLVGKTRHVELTVLPAQPVPGTITRHVPGRGKSPPMYLRNLERQMWYELLPDGKTVYCQLNRIGHGQLSFKEFFERLFEEFERPEVERLILDMRWNVGGNTFLNPPLVNGILKSEKLQEPGSLFVVIGRNTASAAQNTLVELEQRTSAILVGEPTCSPPNFVGEFVPVLLPYSGWRLSISDLFWQTSFPMDYRVWVSPTIYAPPTAEAFRANRDPAMEAITAYLTESRPTTGG